jgi:hypothetical protein
MRNLVLALVATGGLTMLGAAPAAAVGTNYAFCLQGDESPGLSDCSYTSYEQCSATASGRTLQCIANPYYVPEGGARENRRGRQPTYPAYRSY